MQEVALVHVLQTGNHLISEHADSLEGELARAELEQVFKGVAQQLHNQRFVVAFNAKPVDVGDTRGTFQKSVEFVFVFKLWKLCFQGFLFTSNRL